jgi:hypothetical protein
MAGRPMLRDPPHVPIAHSRYQQRRRARIAREAASSPRAAGTDPGRRARVRMDDEIRTMKLTELKARVACSDYHVDVEAVAEAFMTRMLKVHGALCRADVRELLGDAFDEIRLPA